MTTKCNHVAPIRAAALHEHPKRPQQPHATMGRRGGRTQRQRHERGLAGDGTGALACWRPMHAQRGVAHLSMHDIELRAYHIDRRHESGACIVARLETGRVALVYLSAVTCAHMHDVAGKQ